MLGTYTWLSPLLECCNPNNESLKDMHLWWGNLWETYQPLLFACLEAVNKELGPRDLERQAREDCECVLCSATPFSVLQQGLIRLIRLALWPICFAVPHSVIWISSLTLQGSFHGTISFSAGQASEVRTQNLALKVTKFSSCGGWSQRV